MQRFRNYAQVRNIVYSIKEAKINASKVSFETKTSNIKNLNSISDERLEELKMKSNEIRNNIIGHDNLQVNSNYYAILSYFFKSDSHYLKDYTLQEMLTMVVLIIDPNLICLKLSRKYTDFDLEKQCNKIFGFYHNYFINCEEMYARRFCKVNKEQLKEKIKKLGYDSQA